MPIITDPSPPATAEGLILGSTSANPLSLGTGGSLQLSALTMNPPAKRPEWASNGDMDGAALVRIPYHNSREGTFQVRAMDGSMDQAIQAIKLLEDKLQEAITLGAGGGPGLPCLWTPSHATTGLTFYMLHAEITDLPISYESGWFAQHPVLTVNFTAKPFLYGDEVTGPTATGTAPLLTLEVPSVPGDVPAEARLVITDNSSQARRWCEWGLEQRNFSHTSPAPLLIDSEDLVVSGFAGALATRTGGYRRAGAAHDTVSATILPQPIALCGTGDLPHVGTFRVKCRVWATSTAEYYRLTWRSGDSQYGSNAWAQPVATGNFNELDLGEITIEAAEAGTQKWSGRIEAYTTTAGGEVGEVDYLLIFPVGEGYGRLEAGYAYQAGVTTRWDRFASTTAGSALNGRTAPLGGAWVTSGSAAGDFLFSDGGFGIGSEELKRAVTDPSIPRFAALGSAVTDTEVGMTVRLHVLGGPLAQVGTVARFVDSNNYIAGYVTTSPTGTFLQLLADSLGSTTYSANQLITLAADTSYSIRLIVYVSGRTIVTLTDAGGATLAALDALIPDAAPGGGLTSGKPGLLDFNAATNARYFDNVYVATPAAEPTIINSGRALEVRSDANLRQSSDGASYGDIPSRGSRPFIPPAGDANRTTRIAVRAAREDPVTMASRNDGDSLTIATFLTPRYLALPR